MSRILFDVNVPQPLAGLLSRHTVEFADTRGWRHLTNGDLLRVAELDGFDVFVTADTNIKYQQNLTDRRIAIVTLSTNAWPAIRDNANPVIEAVNAAGPASYTDVVLDRPPLLRRPAPKRP